MPFGFVLLGCLLIYFCMFMPNSKNKIISMCLIGLLMCSFIISPFYLDEISINIPAVVWLGLSIVYISKTLTNKQIISTANYSIMAGIVYVILVKCNFDFVFILNAIPTLIIYCVVCGIYFISPKQAAMVLIMTMSILTLCNAFLENSLGVVYFVNIDNLNLTITVWFAFAFLNKIYQICLLKGERV